MGNVSHGIGPDLTELINENIDVIGCNFGSLMPSRQELMMGDGRRDRIGEVRVLKCGKTLEDTCGVFTGFDGFEIHLEKLLDRRPLGAMASLKETGKGGDIGRAAGGGVDKEPGRRGAGATTKHAIELLTTGNHQSGALGSERGGSNSGGGELAHGRSGSGRGGLV